MEEDIDTEEAAAKRAILDYLQKCQFLSHILDRTENGNIAKNVLILYIG